MLFLEEFSDFALEGEDVGRALCVGLDPAEFLECSRREFFCQAPGDAACCRKAKLGKKREDADLFSL